MAYRVRSERCDFNGHARTHHNNNILGGPYVLRSKTSTLKSSPRRTQTLKVRCYVNTHKLNELHILLAYCFDFDYTSDYVVALSAPYRYVVRVEEGDFLEVLTPFYGRKNDLI